ncbi:MAG: hypoxanthine phosphoribosyltransferase [Nitrospirales bacterium]|nr:hypoxanthine phosphoribosyltransferase [Nitrospirales bacterium]
MGRLFGKPLITQEAMRARVRELGNEITRDYRDRDLMVIGILRGAFTFFADLTRAIRLPLQMDFLMVKSQKTKRGQSGKVKVLWDLTEDIKGRHVLIVEDIVDSGLTIEQLMRRLRKRKPASLEVCALLSKTVRRQIQVKVQYVGFEIPDHYVVGYGMDYQQKYRNLPYLAVLDSDMKEPS